jgi:cell division protein FtsN
MRWIFASLAFANIVILIYFLFFDNDQVQIRQPISKNTRGNLVLLSERDDLTERQPSPPSITGHASTANESLCTLIGPFVNLLRAEYFTERLAALDVEANIKELMVSTGSNYWVYLSPEISRKDALRRLAELQKKGIDSYIIPTGNLTNAISLGIYTSEERAVAMRDRVAKSGYKPEIISVPRERQQIWVFLSVREASKIDEDTWLKLLTNEDGIERRQNVCSELLI